MNQIFILQEFTKCLITEVARVRETRQKQISHFTAKREANFTVTKGHESMSV